MCLHGDYVSVQYTGGVDIIPLTLCYNITIEGPIIVKSHEFILENPIKSHEDLFLCRLFIDYVLCVCVCFLPIHSGHQVRWMYQPG